MILEIILALILGIFFGVITGLIPGIHINFVATIIFGLIINQTLNIDIIYIAIFIISIGITHSFIDFIPSLFLGVPSSDTVVSMLPGHQLVNEKRGFEALQLCAWGSLGGIWCLMIIFVLAYYFILPLYDSIAQYIGRFLLVVLVYLIIKEETKNSIFWAIIIVLLSGGFGLIVLNSIHISNSLFLLFTGMFGTAALILSFLEKSSIPKQEVDVEVPFKRQYILGIFLGGVSAMLCSISPGLGNAQAGTLAMTFLRKVQADMMLVVLSAINTINFGLSLLTLYVLSKARNGAILILKNLDFSFNLNFLFLIIIVMIIVSIIAYELVFIIGKQVIDLVNSINMQYVNGTLIIFLSSFVFFTSNLSEIMVYLGAIALGILCVQVGVRRVHLMSVLLVPIIVVLW